MWTKYVNNLALLIRIEFHEFCTFCGKIFFFIGGNLYKYFTIVIIRLIMFNLAKNFKTFT
jgi:hypothetical protein